MKILREVYKFKRNYNTAEKIPLIIINKTWSIKPNLIGHTTDFISIKEEFH